MAARFRGTRLLSSTGAALPQGKFDLSLVTEAGLDYLLRHGWKPPHGIDHLQSTRLRERTDIQPLLHVISQVGPSLKVLAWRCVVVVEPNHECMAHIPLNSCRSESSLLLGKKHYHACHVGLSCLSGSAVSWCLLEPSQRCHLLASESCPAYVE